jgi:tetratricopeptide (TPR) repeat protein
LSWNRAFAFNGRAEELILDGRYVEARTLLKAAIEKMPAGWTPRREDGNSLVIAFWYEAEFIAYSYRERERLTKSICWVIESYSRAWYQLAVVASKQKQYEDALFSIECGLELEPDHPQLWNEPPNWSTSVSCGTSAMRKRKQFPGFFTRSSIRRLIL